MEANDLNVNKVSVQSKISPTTIYSYVDTGERATKALGARREDRIARAYDMPVEAIFGPLHDPGEYPVEPNFIREWREFRGLTIADLAQKVGTTVAILELLEAGEITLSPKWLRRLGPVFETGDAFVLIDPTKVAAELLDTIGVPKERQGHAMEVLDTFRGKATG